MRKFLFLVSTILLLIGSLTFGLKARAQVSANQKAAEASESPATASVRWDNQETGYRIVIEDDADLLSEEEIQQLLLDMQGITDYGNAAFKSLSDNEYSTSYFAQNYYHQIFNQESGTLFIIDMDNREIYIFSDGAIYRTITVSYANTITDNVYTYASDGDYYRCASKAFDQIQSLLSGQKIVQPMKYISNALLALILAALINYFLARILSGTSKPGTSEVLNAVSTKFAFYDPHMKLTSQTKVYSPPSSSSGGGGHSGGGGGGGGGHSSGGGGGHRF